MKKLYIIKCGSTFENPKGDFEDWIIEKLENKDLDILTIDVQKNHPLPMPRKHDAIIITGSHSMVTDEASWSLELEKWLPKIIEDEIPLLAICYGHQLLAKSLGGVSGYHENDMEIGTVDIILEECVIDDVLFSRLPNSFKAHTVHSQTVLELPLNAVRLAFNNHDINHAYRVGSKAWGVQFHPEFDADAMNLYINEVSKKKNLDTNKLISQSEDTVIATSIIKEFERLFL
jgi:GMP synthase (glutamine-hydrolysing)